MSRLLWLVVPALALSACGGAPPTSASVDLPPIDAAGFQAVTASAARPLVVNVWASWCVPCRSEAPLLAAADRRFGDRVRFIGIDVEDTRSSAKAFIAEFGLSFDQYFDRSRAVPQLLGGFGTPITYFILPGGEVLSRHDGIIDERSLALGIDELLHATSGA